MLEQCFEFGSTLWRICGLKKENIPAEVIYAYGRKHSRWMLDGFWVPNFIPRCFYAILISSKFIRVYDSRKETM